MSSSNDSESFDTLSLAETDGLSDFELVDVDNDDVRFLASSSIGSDAASMASDVETTPPSPQMDASHFHFPDPASVFQDEQLSLESSSLYTLLAPSEHNQQTESLQPSHENKAQASTQPMHSAAASIVDLGIIEKMEFLRESEHKQAGPSQPHRRAAAVAPKAVWLVALVAAMLLGFKSSSLLGLSPRAHIAQYESIAKFATPSQHPLTNAAVLATRPASSLGVTSSPSASSLATNKTTKQARAYAIPGCAVQKADPATKGLTVFTPSWSHSSKVRDPVKSSNLGSKNARAKRYAGFAGQLAFNLHPDSPVFPSLPRSSYLDNATTTTWAFWLARLDDVYERSLRPAISAAKDQIFEAARLVQQYHRDQVLPTYACLRQHALIAAQRTAEVTSHYNQDQVRPAFAFVRGHAAKSAQRSAKYREKVILPALAQFRRQAADAAKSTSEELHKAAKRTARMTSQYSEQQLRPAFASIYQQATEAAQHTVEYREKVVAPALAQFRLQAIDAAKTTSEGLNKAGKRFSDEAGPTVQQFKEVAYVNLEALGVDEYVGFMLTSLRAATQSLRSTKQSI
ncbi:hypothetical protein PHSY_002140 [Pseudozyma hubeiensis SY62]|uniref:Uncharacterized protein n=1 Tax=Pseudozyma hubeiensis (strain SY62) TaxID=1305764 RepID=R9P0J5_PSEHS|nr:hypothetical protein PHSY_002140 [Pseudozyma hubeiensis SY62]GAC94567.1 hypothetical protein PHSY_002140 [Pseudozyma hubeiensis SY62]